MAARRKAEAGAPTVEPQPPVADPAVPVEIPAPEPASPVVEPQPEPLRVVSIFAHIVVKGSGEVRMLSRGDVVDPALYKEDSMEHLRSIGFIA